MIVLINIVLQVLDGLLTYIGLHLGHAEGNPLIASAISVYGLAPALITVKCWCCALIVSLRHRPCLLKSYAWINAAVVVFWFLAINLVLP